MDAFNVGVQGINLLKDCNEADGNFVTCLAIKAALISGRKVVLVTIQKGAAHYLSILKKMNIQVDRYKESFVVIDALKASLAESGILQQPCETITTCIASKLSSTAEDAVHPVTIVVDCLTILAMLMEDQRHAWLDFLRSLLAMATEDLNKRALLLVAREDATENKQWISFLEHAADTVITVHALPIGQMADVNVRLSIIRPNRWGRAFQELPSDASVTIHNDLFGKVTERQVQFKDASIPS